MKIYVFLCVSGPPHCSSAQGSILSSGLASPYGSSYNKYVSGQTAYAEMH